MSPRSTIVGGGAYFALLSQIPEPYGRYAYGAVFLVGLVATVVPAPAAGSRWLPLYRAMNFVALNFGQATNKACPDPRAHDT